MTSSKTRICHRIGCENHATLCLVYFVPAMGGSTPLTIETQTLVCAECASIEDAIEMLRPAIKISDGKKTASGNDIRSLIRRAFIERGIGFPDYERTKPRFIPFTIESIH